MKVLILSLSFLPFFAHAHCPHEIGVDNQIYCVAVEWLEGERKINGQFESTTFPSPHLITEAEKTIPQKWIYSKADITLWKKGDSNHEPQSIKNFRVFHYMFMASGMHHDGGTYDFSQDPESGVYRIQSLAFQKMRGCWSLRWTTAAEDNVDTSAPLMLISRFSNLSHEENAMAESLCGYPQPVESPAPQHEHSHD